MKPAQTQYKVRANSRCKTHRLGTMMVFTGPRSTLPPGWTVIEQVKQP